MVKVIADDATFQTVNPDQRDTLAARVAGLVTFFDNSGHSITGGSFCGFSKFTIPPGAVKMAVEIYEGGTIVPVPNLGTACTSSAPTEGTVTLAFRFGTRTAE